MLPVLAHLASTQLKQRYSTARPYGEWLQNASSIADILTSVPEAKRQPPLLAQTASAAANGTAALHSNGSNGNGAKAANGNGMRSSGHVASPEEDAITHLLTPLKTFGWGDAGNRCAMVICHQ